MINAIPLTIIPLVIYNIAGFTGTSVWWPDEIFGLTMVSGTRWVFTFGDLMITLGLAMLFFEVLKSGRTATSTITNHILSTIVLVIYIVEFIIVDFAATTVFFVLTLMALFDVVAGFTITIRAASRDVTFGHSMDGPPV